MRVLLVDGSGLLARRLVEGLERRHEVSLLIDDPRDRGTTADATASVAAVVYGLPAGAPEDPLPALDRASRGMYNLITTAASAEARRFMLLSSLRPFERYSLDHGSRSTGRRAQPRTPMT